MDNLELHLPSMPSPLSRSRTTSGDSSVSLQDLEFLESPSASLSILGPHDIDHGSSMNTVDNESLQVLDFSHSDSSDSTPTTVSKKPYVIMHRHFP